MPRWRIGVFDSRTRRDGDALEYLGQYNPTSDDPEERLSVDLDSAQKWLDKGAKPSETVVNLLQEAGMDL